MKTILSIKEEEEDMISLEFICEEVKEQIKLILTLIKRYKQQKPHLKQQFKVKKQLLFQILHESSSNHLKVAL